MPRLSHADFVQRFGPTLTAEDQLYPQHYVAAIPAAARVVWSAFSLPDQAGVLVRPGMCLPTTDDEVAPIGFIVCTKAYAEAEADHLEAEYFPPAPTEYVGPINPSILVPRRAPPLPSFDRVFDAPRRPFVPPRQPDEDAKPEVWAAYREAVKNAKRLYNEEAQQVAQNRSLLEEAQRRGQIADRVQPHLPPNLAPHIRFMSVRPDGTAMFLVRSPTYRAAVRINQRSILDALAQAGITAHRIDTRIGPMADDLTRAVLRDDRPLPHRNADALRRSAETVTDPDLRAQLLSLANAIEGKSSS